MHIPENHSRSIAESLGLSALPIKRTRAPTPSLAWFVGKNSDNKSSLAVAVEYKKKLARYAFFIGRYDPKITSIFRANWPLIKSVIAGPISLMDFYDDYPCYTLVDAGRALRWPFWGISPDSFEIRDSLELDELIDFNSKLNGIFCNDGEYFELILQREFPFEWGVSSSSAFRILEVLILGQRIGLGRNELLNIWINRKSDFSHELISNFDADAALRLVSAIS